MKRTIEIKHVGPSQHVRALLQALCDRLEGRLGHWAGEATSVHVLFDENGARRLYRAAVTCHVPGHLAAAHEERRDAGEAIRRAFREVERQLDRHTAVVRHERDRRLQRRRKAQRVAGWMLAGWLAAAGSARAAAPSAAAAEALQLLESDEAYEQQRGFLRLEALREPATLPAVRRYLDHRDPETRAYAVRAVAAIEGVAAVPELLERLGRERTPRVRRAILLGLEPFHAAHEGILPACIAALRDRATEVRITAVDIVSRVDDPRARAALRQRQRHEWRRDVRRVLTEAMKRVPAE
jgi:ribosome-associated translation inhibitor RaiA